MSKRKTVLAVTLAGLLLMAGVLTGVYMYYYGRISAELNGKATSYANLAQAAAAHADTAEEAILYFMDAYGSAFADEAPCYAAITDRTGKLLAETRDMLRVDPDVLGYSAEKKEKFWVELKPFMTEEILSEIRAAAPGRYSEFYPDSVTLAGQAGAYQPVAMEGYFYTAAGLSLKGKSFTFSDLPVTRELDSSAGLRLFLYDLHKDPDLSAALITMRENVYALHEKLEQFLADFEAETQGAFDESLLTEIVSVHLSYSRDIRQNIVEIQLGEQNAFFIIQYACKPATLVFHWYKDALVRTAAVLLLLFFASLILAVWYCSRREKLARSRYSFLSAAAHELKTPLSVILSAGECIEAGVSPEKDREYAAMILHEGARMHSLLEDMLRQNRLVSAQDVQKERTDLSALVQREAEKYAAPAAQKDITLQTEIAPGVFADCDADMIAIAVDNFLSNAVKYAPPGAEIIVRAGYEGKKARVSVHNTGSGISADALPHIWEELYREDTVRGDGEGSGLGLSIARRIFELHRAHYGCVSDASGVTFRFTLPAARGRLRAPAAAGQEKRRKTALPRLFAWMPFVLMLLGAVLLYCVSAFSGTDVSIFVQMAGIALCGAGALTGLLFILRTVLYWKDPAQPRYKVAFVLTVLAILLPLLFIGWIYFSFAMGWY